MANYNLIPDLWKTVRAFPNADWEDAFSHGQIQSKLWLIEKAETTLPKNLSCAFICAGWYGLLAALWKQHPACSIKKFRSFDHDPTCAPIADSLHRQLVIKDWEFKASTADIMSLDYSLTHYEVTKADGSVQKLSDRPDLIINTSCEHLTDFKKWFAKIPTGTWVILQNNDFFAGKDHVNCVKSLEEFLNQVPLTKIAIQDSLKLDHYTRFMLIAQK